MFSGRFSQFSQCFLEISLPSNSTDLVQMGISDFSSIIFPLFWYINSLLSTQTDVPVSAWSPSLRGVLYSVMAGIIAQLNAANRRRKKRGVKILYIVNCTLYTVHCTLYTVHCTLYTVYYQLDGVGPLVTVRTMLLGLIYQFATPTLHCRIFHTKKCKVKSF